MKVIKPIEINDSILSSAIQEPDPTIGEVEWTNSRVNYFQVTPQPATLLQSVFSVSENYGVVLQNDYLIRIYNKQGVQVGSFSTQPQGFYAEEVASDGNRIYAFKTVSITGGNYVYDIYIYLMDFTFDKSITGKTMYTDGISVINAVAAKEGIVYATCAILEDAIQSTYLIEYDSEFNELNRFNVSDITGRSGDAFTATIGVSSGSFYIIDLGGTAFELNDSFDGIDSTITIRSSTLTNYSQYPSSIAFNGELWFIPVYINGDDTAPYMTTYYEDFSGGEYYPAGFEVIKTSTHRKYQSATVTNDDPEVGVDKIPPTWVDISATNKYKAFDYTSRDKAEIVSATLDVYEFSLLQSVPYVTFFGLENAVSITVTVEDTSTGTQIYTKTVGTQINAPLEDQLSNPTLRTEKLAFDDLPYYSSPVVIKISLSKITGSTIKIGGIGIGPARTLGETLHQSSVNRKSFSDIQIDEFGNEKILKRASGDYITYEVKVPHEYTNYTEAVLKDALDEIRIWIGEKQNDEKLLSVGYYERSPLVYSGPNFSEISIKVRGSV